MMTTLVCAGAATLHIPSMLVFHNRRNVDRYMLPIHGVTKIATRTESGSDEIQKTSLTSEYSKLSPCS